MREKEEKRRRRRRGNNSVGEGGDTEFTCNPLEACGGEDPSGTEGQTGHCCCCAQTEMKPAGDKELDLWDTCGTEANILAGLWDKYKDF